MPKYLAIEDILILDEIIFHKDEEVIVNNGIISVSTKLGKLDISLSNIKDKLRIKEELDIKISLLEDEDEIKDYRIQLDLKVSRKKAKEIENYLRETLESMI